MTKAKRYTTMEVCEMTGATYRQVDHWCRRGHIPGQSADGPGSGHRRVFTATQVARVRLLLQASALINTRLDEAAGLLESAG